MFEGIVINKGLAIGKIFVKENINVRIEFREVDNIKREIAKLEQARELVEKDIQIKYEKTVNLLGEEEAKVYKTHLKTLNSPILMGQVKKDIQEKKINAEFVLNGIRRKYMDMYSRVNDSFLMKKSDSIQYVVKMMILKMLEFETDNLSEFQDGSILIADTINKSDYLKLANKDIKGIIIEDRGGYAYAKILGEMKNIPVIVGVQNISRYVSNNNEVILDCADIGIIILNPTSYEMNTYEKIVQFNGSELDLDELLKNISDDVKDDFILHSIDSLPNSNAENKGRVGFINTEFSYIGRVEPPKVKELVEDYKSVLRDFDRQSPVIFKVLDTNSERNISFVYNAQEKNPLMGLRGSRWLLNERQIMIDQLVAMMIATGDEEIHIAFPNVVNYNQILEIKLAIDEAKIFAQLGMDKIVKVGVIVDTPSAGLLIEAFCEDIDFVIIDSTKITEFIKGIDKNNRYVNESYEVICPSVIKFMLNTIRTAHKEGLFVCVLGDIVRDLTIPLLIGMGVDKIITDKELKNANWYVYKTDKEHWSDVVDNCISKKSSYQVSMILNEEIMKITTL